MGAAFWRVTLTGLNATAMLAVATAEALTSLDVPGKVWALWTIALVAWMAYCAHQATKEGEARAAAADKMIAAMVERARKNGASQ